MTYNISKNLRKFRKENKLNQEDVAKILNITQKTYSCYETGRTEPDIKSLILLSDLYRVPIDVLVGKYEIVNYNTIQ